MPSSTGCAEDHLGITPVVISPACTEPLGNTFGLSLSGSKPASAGQHSVFLPPRPMEQRH